MTDKIPRIDSEPKADSSAQNVKREEAELKLLEAEASLRKLVQREIGQRYIIKWVALVAGCIVIIGMTAVLWHLVHSAFWGPFMVVNSAFSVAMIVTPILSITTITVALFVGAFRKFEEKDLEVAGSGIVGVANFARSG